MVTKKKKKSIPSFVRIGGIIIILILILFIAFTQRKYLGMQSILPVRPTHTPTPTKIEVLLPDRMSPNQIVYREKAIEDLAEKLHIAKTEIRVISIEETDWPDTSLGCPERGKFYTQVITPGFLILLGVKDETYPYHAGSNRIVDCSR